MLRLGYAASVVAFFVFAHYRYPLVPMLKPLAASGLVNLARLGRARAWRAIIAALAAAAIAGGVSALPRRAQGRRSEAVEALERALALEPDDEEARRLLASARR